MTIVKFPPHSERLISIPFILERWNFWNDAWQIGCSKELVEKALKNNDLMSGPPIRNDNFTPEQHAARIAYLIGINWSDAIIITLIPQFRCADGNHRLCAASYRGDEYILASAPNNFDISSFPSVRVN